MALRTSELIRAGGRATAVAQLRSTFRGRIIESDDPAYDEARSVWNARIDHRPALIARCLGVSDIVGALAFAREQGLEISVRGGGHNIAGQSVADGAVVLDLSLMRGVQVDVARQRAVVQAGALMADLDRETQHFGLATTGGLDCTTGVAGLTLGGGYGWLARRFGLAADNLRSARLVTADGACLRTSVDEEPDLFWAIRGGGGNFGVVAEFEFELHHFGPTMSTGYAFYEEKDALPALRAYRDLVLEAPDGLYLMASVITGAPRWPIPDAFHGRPVVGLSWGWVGDEPGDGSSHAAALHRAGHPIAQSTELISYVAIQSGKYGLDQPRRRAYWKSALFRQLPDTVLETMCAVAAEVNGGRALADAELVSMGGAIARIGEDETAYGNRDAMFDFITAYYWEDPTEDAERVDAMRRIWATVSGLGASGVYFNNLGIEPDQGALESYGRTKYARLAEIKSRFDPDNVFRHTPNVRPTAS